MAKDGYTALICAADNGHLDMVNRLLDCKDIDVNLQTLVPKLEIIDFCSPITSSLSLLI